MKTTSKSLGMALCIIVLLSGCAAIEKQDAIATERLLAAAGFKMQFADTADQTAQLNNAAQRTLVPKRRGDKVYYIYADSLACKCLYVGSEEAYQRYQQLALKKQIANEEVMAAERYEDSGLSWHSWDVW